MKAAEINLRSCVAENFREAVFSFLIKKIFKA